MMMGAAGGASDETSGGGFETGESGERDSVGGGLVWAMVVNGEAWRVAVALFEHREKERGRVLEAVGRKKKRGERKEKRKVKGKIKEKKKIIKINADVA